ncbi:MAG: hypothetical protein GC155_11780 [Alphaproteobacteria bacterium]|nr:hypothetical protein [Alphaproteobacteria bacterium]
MEREDKDLDYGPNVARLLDPPVSPEEWREAQVKWRDPRRRFRDTDIDVLAVRLQFGRGMRLSELAELFGVASSTISARSKREHWTKRMRESERRALSRMVILGACVRNFDGGAEPDPDFLARASAWDALPPRAPKTPPPLWSPQSPDDASEIQTRGADALDPLDDPDNPDRTHRDAVAARLRRLLARLDQRAAELGEAAACDCDGEPVDGDAGAVGGSGLDALGAASAEGA